MASNTVSPIKLTVAQAETLLEWMARTSPDQHYDYWEVFGEHSNRGNADRRVMRRLLEAGALDTDDRSRIKGHTPIFISVGGPTCVPPAGARYQQLIPAWWRQLRGEV